jgi:hypothetical protein
MTTFLMRQAWQAVLCCRTANASLGATARLLGVLWGYLATQLVHGLKTRAVAVLGQF